MNCLAMYTFASKYFYIKREFYKFSNGHFDRIHSTKFLSNNKEVLYLRRFMSSKTSLLTSIPDNFTFDSGFSFAFDLASNKKVFPAVCYLW